VHVNEALVRGAMRNGCTCTVTVRSVYRRVALLVGSRAAYPFVERCSSSRNARCQKSWLKLVGTSEYNRPTHPWIGAVVMLEAARFSGEFHSSDVCQWGVWVGMEGVKTAGKLCRTHTWEH
jgi:hypothetical protein